MQSRSISVIEFILGRSGWFENNNKNTATTKHDSTHKESALLRIRTPSSQREHAPSYLTIVSLCRCGYSITNRHRKSRLQRWVEAQAQPGCRWGPSRWGQSRLDPRPRPRSSAAGRAVPTRAHTQVGETTVLCAARQWRDPAPSMSTCVTATWDAAERCGASIKGVEWGRLTGCHRRHTCWFPFACAVSWRCGGR